ncbi:MAG: NAD(P)/FAD-dependent oxidoreductase [Rhodocyclales bacterium]|nr:NAD(P)/FAD-dependent oxidoreductase [Rhodocyclales bacterium]
MNTLNRRHFLQAAGAAGVLAAIPRAVSAQTTSPRVIVVGGGFGGATVAKYLRMWGGNVQVTLVEPNASYIACVLSNLVLTNAISLTRITLGYSSLQSNHGVSVVQGSAIAIDPPGHRLTVQTGPAMQELEYDHLVLAPGIDFAPAPGSWNPDLTPHAWLAGAQTTLLRNQVASMRNGDRCVVTVPRAPYRCPPGPYERACVIADNLRTRGRTGAKVVLLDANAGIQAEVEAFTHAFDVTLRDWIEYVPNALVTSVDSNTRSIVTTARTVNNARVLNYIPNQKAAPIAAGLGTDAAGFVPVNPLTYATLAQPDVHVIGDSASVPATDGRGIAKSAHMANAEAKVCADAILRALGGDDPDENIATNSACYSPVTQRTASWFSTSFIYGDVFTASGDVKGKGMHRVDVGEAPADRVNNDTFKEMFTWADSLFADSFA